MAVNEVQLLLFSAGRQNFAIDAFSVQQIHKTVPVTRLPHVAEYISGIVNIEGEVMPQIDFRHLLLLQSQEAGQILVLNAEGYRLALLVDRTIEKVAVGVDVVNEFSMDVDDAGVQISSAADYIQSEVMVSGVNYLILNVRSLLRLVKPEKIDSDDNGIKAYRLLSEKSAAGHDDKVGFLTFRLGRETLALPLLEIMEVVEFNRVTHIPGSPDFIAGLAVLRSRPLLALGAARLLDLHQDDAASDPRVLIVQYGNSWLGLLVDQVFGIQYFSRGQVVKETSSVSFIDSYVIDNKQNIVLLLELKSLFSSSHSIAIDKYLPKVEKYVGVAQKETSKMLKVLIGKEVFAIPVENVQRITEQKRYAKLQESKKGIIGTVDIDGNIIPVVNISGQINADAAGNLEQWVVIQHENERWALCVSKATALFDLEKDGIDYNASQNLSVKGIANYKGELVSILDFQWLVDGGSGL